MQRIIIFLDIVKKAFLSLKTWKSHLKAELKFMMQLLKRKKDKYGMDEIILLFCSFFT